ncbi:MAG: thioredoxin-disulfide reductase [Erysipelotrichaceae bacterium]|nr:thioredoxin-disulfide reductase [Erysipelotrichaceae bacterium]
MDLQYDVIIIGSGPAGLTAAIYATRANLTTAIIEGDTPGGKLTKTYEIENYPGFERISGVDLAMQMMEHGQKFGAVMEFSPVTEIDDEGEFKLVHLGDGRVLTTRAVIIATGTNERQLDLPRAKEFTGRGISYCAVCDGAFYRNKEVVVIGGGNSALEESLYLTQLVNKVNIIIRRDVFRADATVVDKVRNNPKINIITKSLPQELVIEDNAIKGLVIKNVETGELSTVECAGIFPYMGADPATGFLKNLNILDERGYIVVNKDMETAVPGVYGAGDVTVKDLRQVVTATNDGAIAANACVKYLNR